MSFRLTHMHQLAGGQPYCFRTLLCQPDHIIIPFLIRNSLMLLLTKLNYNPSEKEFEENFALLMKEDRFVPVI